MKPSKIYSLLLAFALFMAISLSACGDNANTDNSTASPSKTPNNGIPDKYVNPDVSPDDLIPMMLKEIIITSEDLNDTLNIVILSSAGDRLVSFYSADIEKIVIPESDDDGYYEVKFWLTPSAILKADKAISQISDFPIDISINEKTFEFFTRDNALYHYSRALLSVSEGLKGLDCPLFESNITREDFRALFTK